MARGVIDAGIVIGWVRKGHRSQERLDKLLESCRDGASDLYMSTVNLAEALLHTREVERKSGVDTVTFLKACGVKLHSPDEAIARRVAKMEASLADAFAGAKALELGARLHTTDGELVRILKRSKVALSHY